ncbi:MAG TPA: App1 family protein [Burkholderiaceae bacterium]|nr:App1 family protein [Burkholderiaceae bacterium]
MGRALGESALHACWRSRLIKPSATRRRFVVTLASAQALWSSPFRWAQAAGLQADEQVMLFPSTARRLLEGHWLARVEAWVHELESRPGASRIFARYLGLDLSDLPTQDRARFEARTRLFRVASKDRRVLRIKFGTDAPVLLPASDESGRVSAEVVVSAGPFAGPQWLDYSVMARNEAPAAFTGSVLALPDRGLSVISDIDDTIKHTQVRDRREMLLNTFARPFTPVAGMADWMRQCATADASTSFHYVSGGPEQLYPAIGEFLQDEAFPRGTVQLRTVDLTKEVFASGAGTQAHKTAVIGRLLRDFPQRRFLLLGDSGEKDPETYAEIAREHRDRIIAILIRNVTGEDAHSPRYMTAMRDLPRKLWTVFDEPGQLPIRGF